MLRVWLVSIYRPFRNHLIEVERRQSVINYADVPTMPGLAVCPSGVHELLTLPSVTSQAFRSAEIDCAARVYNRRLSRSASGDSSLTLQVLLTSFFVSKN
jgi:hypothetical protein